MIFLYYWFVFNFKDFFTCANYTNRQEMYFFISNILKTLRPNSSTCDITQSREKKKRYCSWCSGAVGYRSLHATLHASWQCSHLPATSHNGG